MRKLALLIFATLILGCGTETPVVEEPEPVINELPPTVASGEYFRIDIADLVMEWGTVWDGEDDVDPAPLNQVGIQFGFNKDLRLYKIDILHDGKSLFWVPKNIVEDITSTVTATPLLGLELEFDTEYVVKIYAQDLSCRASHFEVRFRTMPEP